jgi:hypothetical protein
MSMNDSATGNGSTGKGPTRSRRRFWFDPRFAIGVVLVIASVAGVVGLVSSADASVDVLAARTTLTPGEQVSADDLVPTSVRAGQAERLYLRAKDVPADGVVITRAVAAGELVPSSAVGSAAGLQLTSVVVPVNTELAASIGPGSRVDVWSARAVDSTSFAAPTVLVSSAIVVRIIERKQLVADQAGGSVELLVPRFSTAGVLEATANGAALSIVPVDLPLGG